jgi:hypothetical protein
MGGDTSSSEVHVLQLGMLLTLIGSLQFLTDRNFRESAMGTSVWHCHSHKATCFVKSTCHTTYEYSNSKIKVFPFDYFYRWQYHQ